MENCESRFHSLGDEHLEELYQHNDVVYVDYTDKGDLFLTNKRAKYDRPMFILTKGFLGAKTFLGSIVWSLKMRDGSVHFTETIETVGEDEKEITKALTTIIDKLNLEFDKAEHLSGYFTLKNDKDEWLAEIDLDNILPDCCSSFDIVRSIVREIDVILVEETE